MDQFHPTGKGNLPRPKPWLQFERRKQAPPGLSLSNQPCFDEIIGVSLR
ncbi:MAG: hypothetical protein ANABAC_1255 [Anaerolineae bacterium]|nr:MAG: hypothetical protein ANABAC_1255 [Anaerolineae bacterium]